jgi:hypothetical protein
MADVPGIGDIINSTQVGKEVGQSILSALPPEAIKNIDILIRIFQAVGIVVIVYFIFLIIRVITNILTSRRIKSINENVKEINGKLDLIIGKKGKEEKKKK